MRIISHGAICAVNAKEKRRLEKYRAAQERKRKNDERRQSETGTIKTVRL